MALSVYEMGRDLWHLLLTLPLHSPLAMVSAPTPAPLSTPNGSATPFHLTTQDSIIALRVLTTLHEGTGCGFGGATGAFKPIGSMLPSYLNYTGHCIYGDITSSIQSVGQKKVWIEHSLHTDLVDSQVLGILPHESRAEAWGAAACAIVWCITQSFFIAF